LYNYIGTGSETQKRTLLEYAKKLTTQQSDGLPYETQLQVGGEYFISTNIDVQDGLFNGATGSLKKIEYGMTAKQVKVPKSAWMDFRNPLIGLSKRASVKWEQQRKQIPPEWVPVERITRNLSKTGRHKGLEIIRTQIPLVAANGMTICKSQGSSIPLVVVSVHRNKGRKLSRELLYVACSRATSRNGLFIDGDFEPPEKPGPNDPVTLEMERLRGKPLQFSIQFLQDFGENYEKLYFHNVQSFVAHHQDVEADHCAMASTLLAFVEPHLLKNDQFNLPNYDCIHRTNCRKNRNSEGALVFRKSEGLRNIFFNNSREFKIKIF
jgi:hypothetical protein